MRFVDMIRAAQRRAERELEGRLARPWLCTEIDGLKTANGSIQITAGALEEFLYRTADAGPSRGERLRQLAIQLESEELEDGWAGLRRIYEAAVRESPDDPLVFHSWGITAELVGQSFFAPREEQARIWKEAELALNRALALSPDDSDIIFSMGRLHYNDPSANTASGEHADRALPWFNRALDIDPHHAMPALYRAHCYHDKKDWPAAVRAYDAVDQARLLEQHPSQEWRVVKLREQLAFCLAQAGQHAEAKQRFFAFIDDIAQFDDDEIWDLSINVKLEDLESAAISILKDPALLEATRAIGRRWRLEHRDATDQ